MKKWTRLLIGVACAALLFVSWLITINSKSASVKQSELLEMAESLINDGIYIRAAPLLEEAAGYKTARTREVEEELKKVYLMLIGTRGFSAKYTSLLETQMSRSDADPGVFAEAAGYYLSVSKISYALDILKTGIAKTGDDRLVDLYEQNRYVYETNRGVYDYVSAIYGSTVQVRRDGLWGIAGSEGITIIPCEYEKVSTFSIDRAIVRKGNEVFAVDQDNNRVAKLNDSASDFGNFADDRVPLLIDEGWKRATGELVVGTASFEQLGMYSAGYAAAKAGGKWGVVDVAQNWLIPAEYDGIVQDELGRCYARGAVFVVRDGMVFLVVDGFLTGDAYEDAKPFSNEGYAAVKKNGKWGFIDVSGTVVIDFKFDDALSFGQHLAAVKLDELWGYISISGSIAIEPVFLEAKSFSNGSAPVLTQRGWQFITLVEYKRGVSL